MRCYIMVSWDEIAPEGPTRLIKDSNSKMVINDKDATVTSIVIR